MGNAMNGETFEIIRVLTMGLIITFINVISSSLWKKKKNIIFFYLHIVLC